jgi:hypothetical protein
VVHDSYVVVGIEVDEADLLARVRFTEARTDGAVIAWSPPMTIGKKPSGWE